MNIQRMRPAETTSLSSVFINFVSQTTISVIGNQSAESIASTAATSINVICTAMIVDAAAVTPIGLALQGIHSYSGRPGIARSGLVCGAACECVAAHS
jgi:nicotinate-nucleotide pyrophosphorylase